MNRLSRETNPYAAPALSIRHPTVVDRKRRTRSSKRLFLESLAFVAGFYLAIVIHSLWIDYPVRETLLDAFTHVISLAVFVVNVVVNTVLLRTTQRSIVLNIIGGVAVIYGGLWLIDYLPPIAGPDGLPLISLVVSAVLFSLMVTGVTAAFEFLRTAEMESATEQRGYDE